MLAPLRRRERETVTGREGGEHRWGCEGERGEDPQPQAWIPQYQSLFPQGGIDWMALPC